LLGIAFAQSQPPATPIGFLTDAQLRATPVPVSIGGNQAANVAQFGGSNVVTGVGASGAGIPRFTVSNDSSLGILPLTAGGLSPFRLVSAGSTNATNIKASAGQLYNIVASNVNASPRFIHTYNNAGSPTCNASIVNTFLIPGSVTGGLTPVVVPVGVAHTTGIAICITTANDGTGDVGAGDIVLNVMYK
jgi:hypothetical protein